MRDEHVKMGVGQSVGFAGPRTLVALSSPGEF
jgi:hypothetical protein